METIRLYAFRVLIIGILIIGLVSCPSEKKDDDSGGVTEIDESKANLVDIALDGAGDEFYITRLKPVEQMELNDFRYRRHVLGVHGIYLFDKYSIYSYDPELNGFARIYNTETEYKTEHSSIGDFYIVDEKLIKNYGNSISPNTGVPIYKHGNFYISQHKKNQREHAMVYSSDLIHWTVSALDCPAPIVFFEKGNNLFALAANKVWNVSNPVEPTAIRELSETILRPLPGEPYYAVRDETVLYAFNLDEHIFACIDRVYEDGPQRYFLVINTDDFTYTLSEVTEQFRGPYLEKAVKRDDGWKIYLISTEKILVIDPFTEDGPTIVEELPGSQN